MPCKRGYAARELKSTRKFGGKTYRKTKTDYKSKSKAEERADKERSKGKHVRLIYHPHKRVWSIYVR